MRVLVTGATGFLGLNVVRSLLEDDHEPVALVRESSPTGRLPDGVATVCGDVTDRRSLESAVERTDAVIHLAAVRGAYVGSVEDWHHLDWERMRAVNVAGSETLFEVADEAGVDRVVFASTFRAHPEVRPADPDDYVRSKVLAGDILGQSDYGFEHTILYPTYLMGPRDHRLVRFRHFWYVETNRVVVPPLYSPVGMNVVHVEDVADAAVHGLGAGTDKRYFVTGENVSGERLHRTIAEVTETSCVVVGIPRSLSSAVVAPVADTLHRRGLFPVGGERFRFSPDQYVPEEYENRTPVGNRGLRAIARDGHDWYASVGLL